jgi:hypothetical protein
MGIGAPAKPLVDLASVCISCPCVQREGAALFRDEGRHMVAGEEH